MQIRQLRGWLVRLFSLFRQLQREREFAEELESHLAFHIEDNLRAGMSPEEARRQALIKLGGVTQTQELHREQRGLPMLETLLQDLRFGVRLMLKQPGVTAVMIIVLALGIGANTAIFSVVNALVFNPLPYRDPQQLMWVTNEFRGNELIGGDELQAYRQQSQMFEAIGAYHASKIRLSTEGNAEEINRVVMTASMFPMLGVVPRWGRVFTPEDDKPGAARVVVLNYDYWQRRFGGNPAVIGQDVRLGAEKWTIIGVMPPGFRFLPERRLGGNVDVFVPMGFDPGLLMSLENDVIGRLKPGVAPEQARAELNLILQSFIQAHPEMSGRQASVRPLAEKMVGHLRRGLLALFGVVVCVLLIACANVANLLLARGGVRQKEMAIRTALGAGRKRLLRQMLTESLLLVVLGGLAGCWLAWWGVKVLVALAPEDLPQLKLARVDDAVLWFTFAATLLAGTLAVLIPAWQAARIEVNESLKDGARGSSFLSRKNARRVSPALVVVELALTLVLLIGAGLLIKSFVRLRAVDPGYNSKNLLTMGMPFNDQRTPALRQELRTRLMALPGVQAVTYSRLLPLHDNGIINKYQFTIAGRPLVHDEQKPLAEVNFISPDFFRALATPLLAGRDFTEHDNENAPRVIVINEAFARRHFAGESPLGQRIYLEGLAVEATVIGVAADVKWVDLTAEVPPGFYAPTLQYPKQASWGMAIRTAGDPLQLLPAIRQAVAEVAPGRRLNPRLMEQRVADSLAPRRLQLLLFSIFAAVALVLAAVGVYGVISYSVSRRTHEIGIRMALGAQVRHVLWLVVRQGMTMALIGVAVGLAAAYALTRLMASLLFNATPTDPATFVIISLLLIGIALLAAYLPARRATKVDPLIALRHE